MWTKSFNKIYSGIKRKDIWDLWVDVNNWPKWHEDLEYCKMDGEFRVGNHFLLKPKGVGPVKIILTEIDEGKKFTDCTIFFGAKMYDIHTIEETSDGLKISNTVTVTGPLKWLWVKLVAQNVANTSSRQMEKLVELARSKYV
jgi:hypothetical protein